MSGSNAEPSEAKDLALVDKLELKIALADSETKFGSLLNTYLAPLLLKLASEHVAVRTKVISVCKHINTRIKSPTVNLPVAALLKQYKDQQNALIRYFDLLYIQQGFDRLTASERIDLLPLVLGGLSRNFQESAANSASIFNIFLRILHQLELPPRGTTEDRQLRSKLGLDEEDEAKFVATWIGKLILFFTTRAAPESCPGLTTHDCEFLQLNGKPDTWNPATSGGLNLIETKVVAIRFLASGAFTDQDKFLPALFASADPNSRLSDIGDDILKFALPSISLEDPDLIRTLLNVYLGSTTPEYSPPVRPPLRSKILNLLCKSHAATSYCSEILRIAKEGLATDPTNAARQGLEASKLRTQVFNFANWVARMAKSSDIAKIAPTLVSELHNYIESQGWPTIHEEIHGNPAELASRSYGYESIGMLAKACPEKLLLEPDLELLRWLFDSLAYDGSAKDVSLSIEQALSSVLSAFAQVSNPEIQQPLMHLLIHYAILGEPGSKDASGHTVVRNTRYVAVRFANRCLPYSNVHARWIDLLALAGGSSERGEVVEEGRRGLDPYWYRILNPLGSKELPTASSVEDSRYAMPSFEDLVEFVFSDKERALELRHGYNSAIVLCRTILLHEAISQSSKPPIVDTDWERNIDAVIHRDEDIRTGVVQFVSSMYNHRDNGRRALDLFLDAAFTGFTSDSLEEPTRSGQCLLDLCQFVPREAVDNYSPRISELKGRIYSNDRSSRVLASHIFGLLASGPASAEPVVGSMADEFWQRSTKWKSAIGSNVHQVHGSLVSLGYWAARTKVRQTSADLNNRTDQMMDLLSSIINDSKEKEILEAAVLALCQLSLFGLIQVDKISSLEGLKSIPPKLEAMAKKGDENAVHALGYLAMQCAEASGEQNLLPKLVDSLYGLHETKLPELQFAVGSALSCAAIGWKSKVLVGLFDVEGVLPREVHRDSTLNDMAEQILENCKQTKPSLRQASVIWLLSLVEYCGHCPEIKSRLRECQRAFKGFLADKYSLNQEAASRGLALVYDNGDEGVKDDLIRDLVGSFTAAKSNLSGTVSDDTQLFEPGALPTGAGSSVTTYKDIINLASEVGDPTLVYRFMSLASNSAIWSSRAAFGRFGLSRILSDSGAEKHLSSDPKLYSALYRYRFDPNDNVRTAMSQIWTTLVKDPKSTINAHFDRILEDLLKSILNREWRTRQASCAALADLIQGRPLAMYEQQLTKIWELTFKVCDDIKDSVCNAAIQLARVLRGILTRSLEAGEESAKNANAMLEQVLPLLLSPSGIEAAAKKVQAFAMITLMDVVKQTSPKVIRPYLAELVGRLLALLSSVEPDFVNYIHLNADKYGMTEQGIDDLRLNSVKLSPMMETIERCLDLLDDASMKDLATTLTNAIRTVIGLPSKVGVSRVFVTLATRHRFLFQAYADKFLRLLRRQVLDRNDTISTTAATTCGYLSRIASDEEILKLVEYAKELYFESTDDGHRTVAGELLHGMSKYAPDRFNSLASACLPFAFFGSHDSHQPARELFKSAWQDHVGGSRAVLLYLREIIDLSTRNLDSSRWSVKHTAAFTIADTVEAAGNDISIADSKLIWPSLEVAIGGKTWEGKEKVLDALVVFGKTSSLPKESVEVGEQMQRIVIRESKRSNPAYRQHALSSLADFIEHFKTSYWYDTVSGIVSPVIEEAFDDESDKMEIDSGGTTTKSSKQLQELTVANGLRALLNSVAPVPGDGIPLMTRLSQSLVLVRRGLAMKSSTVTSAIIAGEKSLFASLADANLAEYPDQVLTDYCLTLFELDDFAEAVRMQAAEAALVLAPLCTKGERLQEAFRRSVSQAISRERSYSVQQTLKAIVKVCS